MSSELVQVCIHKSTFTESEDHALVKSLLVHPSEILPQKDLFQEDLFQRPATGHKMKGDYCSSSSVIVSDQWLAGWSF